MKAPESLFNDFEKKYPMAKGCELRTTKDVKQFEDWYIYYTETKPRTYVMSGWDQFDDGERYFILMSW